MSYFLVIMMSISGHITSQTIEYRDGNQAEAGLSHCYAHAQRVRNIASMQCMPLWKSN